MSSYNFQGDLSLISQRQLDFISEILENKNIKGPDVLVEPIGKAGDNYVANVKRIIVDNDGSTFKMVAKFAPTQEIIRKMMNSETLFRNEHILYTEILPKYKQLQLKADLSKDEMFRHPECYGSLSEGPDEVIVLEDLNEAGFETLSRFKSLSPECVKVTLKNLAIFHSFSYVLKHSEPETFNAIKSKLIDLFTELAPRDDNFTLWLTGLEEMTLNKCLTDDKYKKVVKGSLSELLAHATKCMKADKDSKYSVIRQGDGWTNNIMFKINNGFADECVLIDYQLVFESSPVHDIVYMMFNSTDHEQRLEHYHEFIDHYHSELDKSLNNFGLKASYCYPRDLLDADLKRYAKLTVALCLMVANFILKKPEEAELAMKTMEKLESQENGQVQDIPPELFESDPETFALYKKKVEGIVDSLWEFGLLSK